MSEELNFSGLEFGTGWIHDPVAVRQIIEQDGVRPVSDFLGSTGAESPTITDLTKYLEKAYGPQWYELTNQKQCGSCVAASTACAINLLEALNHVENGADLPPVTCIEALYASSRVDIGQNRLWGQGSVAAWAASAASKIGVTPVGRYAGGDFSHYDASRCCGPMSRQHLPADMRAAAAKTTVKTYAQAKAFSDVVRAIEAGYPVVIASNQGFAKQRDAQGFASPSGSWSHSMACLGVRHDRPGALIANSWGPYYAGGPAGMCPAVKWVDASVVERMLRADDSWVLSDLQGWPRKGLNFARLNW